MSFGIVRPYSVEAERGIALLEEPCARKSTDLLEHRVSACVLGNDQTLWSYKSRRVFAEKMQGCRVFRGGFIGRIEKKEVEGIRFQGELSEGPLHGLCKQRESGGCDGERCQIASNGRDGRRGTLHEAAKAGAAAERLEADRAGAGVKVRKAGAGEARAEHVEQGFAETVAAGSRVVSAGSREAAGAKLSSDDAHLFRG